MVLNGFAICEQRLLIFVNQDLVEVIRVLFRVQPFPLGNGFLPMIFLAQVIHLESFLANLAL